jgi:hypothetical protein
MQLFLDARALAKKKANRRLSIRTGATDTSPEAVRQIKS